MKRCLRLAFLFVGMGCLYWQTYAMTQRNVPKTAPSKPRASARVQISARYFPLEIGNEWVYSDGTSSFRVQVLRESTELNGKKYFEVSGYFQSYDSAEVRKIRQEPLGQIREYNPNGEDFLWYGFIDVKGEWRLETSDDITCVTDSRVIPGDSREAVSTPARTFENALRLDFASRCVDAGFIREYFVQDVGLIQRVNDNIGGNQTFKLVSARVGSLILPTISYGIEVSMDHPAYYSNLMPPVINPWPTAHVMLIVRNNTEMPVEFTFPTAQRFDFIVRDASGKEVLRWSDGKAFAQVIGKEILVNESRSYRDEIVLKRRGGDALPAGFYTLTGYLTIEGWESGSPNMLGVIPFEVRDLH